MRAHRKLAALATAGAMLAATAGALLVGAGAASAAPAPNPPTTATSPGAYPPPPYNFSVNKATVKVGQGVQVTGRHFTPKTRITITIRYKKHPNVRPVVIYVTSNKDGYFALKVNLAYNGYVVISAYGKPKQYSWVYVIVVNKAGHHAVLSAPVKASTTHKTVTVAKYDPMLMLQKGPLGLAAGDQASTANDGGVAGRDASLLANSKDLTPASSQFPMGAVGGGLAAVGLVLTVLALRRRRPEADS